MSNNKQTKQMSISIRTKWPKRKILLYFLHLYKCNSLVANGSKNHHFLHILAWKWKLFENILLDVLNHNFIARRPNVANLNSYHHFCNFAYNLLLNQNFGWNLRKYKIKINYIFRKLLKFKIIIGKEIFDLEVLN